MVPIIYNGLRYVIGTHGFTKFLSSFSCYSTWSLYRPRSLFHTFRCRFEVFSFGFIVSWVDLSFLTPMADPPPPTVESSIFTSYVTSYYPPCHWQVGWHQLCFLGFQHYTLASGTRLWNPSHYEGWFGAWGWLSLMEEEWCSTWQSC